MITDKLKEKKEYEAKVATLEKEIKEERAAKLPSLHKEVGLESTEALINALRGLPKQVPKKKKRIRLTPAQKEKIAKAIKAGFEGNGGFQKIWRIPTHGSKDQKGFRPGKTQGQKKR